MEIGQDYLGIMARDAAIDKLYKLTQQMLGCNCQVLKDALANEMLELLEAIR